MVEKESEESRGEGRELFVWLLVRLLACLLAFKRREEERREAKRREEKRREEK